MKTYFTPEYLAYVRSLPLHRRLALWWRNSLGEIRFAWKVGKFWPWQ